MTIQCNGQTNIKREWGKWVIVSTQYTVPQDLPLWAEPDFNGVIKL